MTLRTLGLAAAAAGALAIAGCATPYYYDQPYAYGSPGPYTVYERPAPVVAQRVEYGVVEGIDLYRDGSNAPTGLGAIIGGVAGGIIGHQFGAGSGNTAATIGGAVLGGLAGNEVQRSSARDHYRIRVRLDSGGTVDVADAGEGQLRVGDRVRVVNGRVYRM
ncbi:MAG TPA: glycine zipper 2TM domain-containing protein [Casimicrobiaceae bacterium]|nr:glycine zipper 2TM domain-containing protein [Casimicrobiaceae bacterium]